MDDLRCLSQMCVYVLTNNHNEQAQECTPIESTRRIIWAVWWTRYGSTTCNVIAENKTGSGLGRPFLDTTAVQIQMSVEGRTTAGCNGNDYLRALPPTRAHSCTNYSNGKQTRNCNGTERFYVTPVTVTLRGFKPSTEHTSYGHTLEPYNDG